MTSNVGSQVIGMAGDLTDEEIEERVAGELRGFFRPEFLNRLDETITFGRLTEDDLAKIVTIQVRRLGEILAAKRITIDVAPEAGRELAAKGYDPVYGARPLKRVIQKEIQNALARRILEGAVREGDHVDVGFDGESFTFSSGVPEVVTNG
jgi:ATP-dependent Clp protease ATP-binding subunit ClpB